MTAYVIAFDAATATRANAAAKRIQSLEPGKARQLLDSVWFLPSAKTGEQIYEHVNSALAAGDRLIVVESTAATYRDLLTPVPELNKAGL